MGATAIPISAAVPAAVRNILFTTDFSNTSDAALPFALALAKHFGAAIFVTHVLPPEPHYELPIEPPADAINTRKLDAQKCFDRLLASGVLHEVVHEPILRSGDFWETIQDVICTRAIDLIVAGTHGRQGWRKLVLGSVAEIIFRNAACPVLTVGPFASPQLLTEGIRRVLYATDFSPVSLAALPYAYALVANEGAQLTLLHVIQPAPPTIDTVVMPQLTAESADEVREQLQTILQPYAPLGLQPELLVMDGAVAESVVRAAAERKATMVVMGVRHKGRTGAHFPWSVADAVVCRAHCPVLTVRGE